MTKEEFENAVQELRTKHNCEIHYDYTHLNNGLMVVAPSVRFGDYSNGIFGVEPFDVALEAIQNMIMYYESTRDETV